MRILYFGKFIEAWRTENWVRYALQQHGVEVIPIQFTNRDPSIENDLSQVRHYRPDVVLFSKAFHPYYAELISKLRASGIVTACWMWDLVWGLRNKVFPQFHSDILFTTDGGNEDAWESNGLAHHRLLRQGIHGPEHHIVKSGGYTHDVAFVGSLTPYSHPNRKLLVEALNEVYDYKFLHIRTKRGMNLNRWMSRVKIVVGDSYPSPNYWSNRIYEMLGRGAFLLYPRTPGLEAEFEEGKHYIGFEQYNFDEMLEKITEWLPKESERERVRQAGFERCGEFTYTRRVETLLAAIQRKMP